MILETNRLFFREFTEDDAPLIHTLNSDPAVLTYVHEEPPKDIAASRAKIIGNILPQYHDHGYGRWAVFEKQTRSFIGWCGLKYRPERNETDLGYRFIRSCWGKGFGMEAAKAAVDHGFSQLQLEEISAMAHIDNHASLKILEKIGFQFIGNEIVDTCPVRTYRLRAENH